MSDVPELQSPFRPQIVFLLSKQKYERHTAFGITKDLPGTLPAYFGVDLDKGDERKWMEFNPALFSSKIRVFNTRWYCRQRPIFANFDS